MVILIQLVNDLRHEEIKTQNAKLSFIMLWEKISFPQHALINTSNKTRKYVFDVFEYFFFEGDAS